MLITVKSLSFVARITGNWKSLLVTKGVAFHGTLGRGGICMEWNVAVWVGGGQNLVRRGGLEVRRGEI